MTEKFQTDKVITLSASHLVHDTYTAFLAPMLPLLISKLGISFSMAGLLDVVRKIPSLFNPFLGLMADRICVKYLVIVTPAISAISMSLLGLAPSYAVIFIFLSVTGISSTLFHIPAPVMIKQFSGAKSGTGMSYFMFGGEMARTLGPLLITAALSIWGLEGSYRVMPLGIVASILLFFKLKNIASLQKKHQSQNLKRVRDTLRDLGRFFIAVSGFLLFRAAMKSALTLYLPTYLTSKGESIWLAGGALSVLQFAGALGTFSAGFIADRLGHQKVLLIAAGVAPLVMGGFIYASPFLMMPLLILMGILLFASGPVILALVQSTNSDRPAFVNSIYMTLNFGISSLMVLVVGILGDQFGLQYTYQVCAVLALFAFPFVFLLPGKE